MTVPVSPLQAVELPLTHPELYEDIGIKPPKVWPTFACQCRPDSNLTLSRACLSFNFSPASLG